MNFDMNAPLRITDASLEALCAHTDPETARSVWREAEAKSLARQDPLILASYIVRTSYRLLREWGRTLGVLGSDSALSALSLDKLLLPQPYGDPPYGPFSVRAYAAQRRITDDSTISTRDCLPGLPLLPSHNPAFCRRRKAAFADAMQGLSIFLRLDEEDYTARAIPYLLSSPPLPENWPEPNILYAYEAALVDEILGIMLDKGTRKAEHMLRKEQGLLAHEARGLMKLAKFESRARMEADVEEDRAILAMRLEDLISRSRESFDQRVELGAIKQLSIVLGVTRSEPADALSEFANVVRRVSQGDAPLLSGASTAIIPAGADS